MLKRLKSFYSPNGKTSWPRIILSLIVVTLIFLSISDDAFEYWKGFKQGFRDGYKEGYESGR